MPQPREERKAEKFIEIAKFWGMNRVGKKSLRNENGMVPVMCFFEKQEAQLGRRTE